MNNNPERVVAIGALDVWVKDPVSQNPTLLTIDPVLDVPTSTWDLLSWSAHVDNLRKQGVSKPELRVTDTEVILPTKQGEVRGVREGNLYMLHVKAARAHSNAK